MSAIDAAALVEFLDVPIGGAFDVPPTQAITYFQAKGLKPTFSYADMLGEAHDHAFTVAKMMNVDMLAQIRSSLDSAMANGTSFKEWSDSIIPVLQSGGWWGRKEVLDPITGGPMIAQLGSPWRLETIFRTNMQSSYAAGQWQEIVTQQDIAPWLMYDAVDDLRTRPLHASWDRKVLPVKSAWWKTHYPPNGYNCRCGVIQLTADELEALNLEPASAPPEDGTYTWTNPRTGGKELVPQGLDPGFDKNAGVTYLNDLDKLLQEKIANLPPDMKAAATSVQASVSSAAALKAAEQLKTALADAQAAAAIKAAQDAAIAAAAAKEASKAAQIQLQAIANAAPDSMVGAAYKKKALQLAQTFDDWTKLSWTERLAKVNALADAAKLKTETASKLSTYKKAVLEGKIPAPSLVKALKSLPADEQATFLAKVDFEVKAFAAAKKAAQEAEAAAAAKAQAEAAAKAKAAAESAAAQAAATKAAKAAAKKAAPTPTPAPATPAAAIVTTPGAPPDPKTLVKIGEQRGSNPGGTYQDTATGTKWYIKQPASADVVRNEVLGGKLYELAGVEAPELHMITLDGKPAIASRIVDGLEKGTAAALAKTPGALEGFAVDAWLANWDVVGLGYDNLLVKAGRAFRVDTGGALRFRAQGGLKGDAFGTSVEEIVSLRQPTNRQAASVFGKITDAQLHTSVARVLAIPEADIRRLVDAWGPTDAAERALLADKLIARQRDLAKRYPEAAKMVRQPEPPAKTPAGRVTDAEQAQVEAGRANGYTFTTDGDAIEDNGVLVHAYKTAEGKAATRGYMKLQPEAGAALMAQIAKTAKTAPSASGLPQVDLSATRNSLTAAVKSINIRADKGEVLPAIIIGKIDTAIADATKSIAELRKAAGVTTTNAKALEHSATYLEGWVAQLKAAKHTGEMGRKTEKLAGKFELVTEIQYKLAPTTAAEPVKPGVQWTRVNGEHEYNVAKFDKGNATETTATTTLSGSGVSYHAQLADGTRLTYFPHDNLNGQAIKGALKIDVPGKSAASTARVFEAMDELGIKATRSSEIDRQLLYLNSYARLRLIRDTPSPGAYARYNAIKETGAEGIRKRLALIKAEVGVDIAASEGWKQVDGVRQAFGHGRAYQIRPDLDTPDFRKMGTEGYAVFHNPKGLSRDAGSGVFARVKEVISGGGTFAALMDRYRRGVALRGSSVSSDMRTGGGDYHFTRILKGNNGTGLYWKTNVLRRMDAITYTSDQFGNTANEHVLANRQGQTPASLRSAARGGSNETIFKGGLSVFDDLDHIVLKEQSEVDDALKWLRTAGYDKWPDGRELTDVVITQYRKGQLK